MGVRNGVGHVGHRQRPHNGGPRLTAAGSRREGRGRPVVPVRAERGESVSAFARRLTDKSKTAAATISAAMPGRRFISRSRRRRS